VTFNYEFLEDFRDETGETCSFLKRYTWQIHYQKNDLSYMFRWTAKDYIHVGDDVSMTSCESKIQDKRFPVKTPETSMHGFTTTWGPLGFKKDLHPLSIMVF
jgi:hypothetical protein